MGQEGGCDRAAWPEVGSGYPSRQVNSYPKHRRLKKVTQGTQGLRSSRLKPQRKKILEPIVKAQMTTGIGAGGRAWPPE